MKNELLFTCLAEVTNSLTGDLLPSHVGGAFVRIVGRAENKTEFIKSVEKRATAFDFNVLAVEEIETLEEYHSRVSDCKALDVLLAEIDAENEITFGTFHTYPPKLNA